MDRFQRQLAKQRSKALHEGGLYLTSALSPRVLPFRIRPRVRLDGSLVLRDRSVFVAFGPLLLGGVPTFVAAVGVIWELTGTGSSPMDYYRILGGLGVFGLAFLAWAAARIWVERRVEIDPLLGTLRISTRPGFLYETCEVRVEDAVVGLHPVECTPFSGKGNERKPWVGFAAVLYAGSHAVPLAAARDMASIHEYLRLLPEALQQRTTKGGNLESPYGRLF